MVADIHGDLRCGSCRGACGASRTVPGTVNAALVSYYQSTAFTNGLDRTTQQNRRAILEQFRSDHGDKRIALMHGEALQKILDRKTPAAARNFEPATRGIEIRYSIPPSREASS
jgi:hypothetical protein